MSPEALVLGLLSAGRTVPLAVVYAALLDDRPRRLLGAYVAAGLAVSLGVGTVALVLFEGSAASREASTGRLLADLVLGALALVAAVVSRADRFAGGAATRGDDRGPAPAVGGWAARLRRLTVPRAALAGGVTNLPGLYYLAGLVAILATNPTPVGGAVQVVVYNLLRFAPPVLALGLLLVRPDRTVATVRGAHAWAMRHRRNLVTAVLGLVGAYLVAKALFGLLG